MTLFGESLLEYFGADQQRADAHNDELLDYCVKHGIVSIGSIERVFTRVIRSRGVAILNAG